MIRTSSEKNTSGKCNKSDSTKAGNDSWFVRIVTTSRIRKLMEGVIHLIRWSKIMNSIGSSRMTAWLSANLQRRMFAKPLVLGMKCVKSMIMTHLYVGNIADGHLRRRNQTHKKGSLTSYQYEYDL